jgi:antitoxin StbD
MQELNTDLVTTISEFKKNPSAEVKRAGNRPFAVLKNNKPSFYVLSPELYEELAEKLWEAENTPLILKRSAEHHVAIRVDLDDHA